MDRDALLINIYGASGTGKSIAASSVANALKMNGINAEYAREWVKEELLKDKDFWRSDRSNQRNITRNQSQLIAGYMTSGAEVIVTDSPLLLGKLYGRRHGVWSEGCERELDMFNCSFRNQMHIMLMHDHTVPFQTFGRNEDRNQSMWYQKELETLLDMEGIYPSKGTLESLIGEEYKETFNLIRSLIWQHNSRRDGTIAKVQEKIIGQI